MYKTFTKYFGVPPGYAYKFLLTMKVFVAIILTTVLQVRATNTFAQKITLKERNARLSTVIDKIRSQSNFGFVFSEKLIDAINGVDIDIHDGTVEEALTQAFKGKQLTFTIDNKVVVIRGKEIPVINMSLRADSLFRGRIINSNTKSPLVGATVKNTSKKTEAMTNQNGEFQIMAAKGDLLSITFVGYETELFTVSRFNQLFAIEIKEAVNEMQDVVISTGIYTRAKESFTGSAATYNATELRQAGGTNVIQSLKTLDPAFAVINNNVLGSDPNRLPNLEIRGKSSVLGTRDELGQDPNQPLFILDGFESTLQAINDIDINRIESITILKDAASTAIYGSKAANGVVVVETVKPKAGKLQVSYNANTNISAPDLTSYNLMNASEKLQFEVAAGRYNRAFVPSTPNNYSEVEMRLADLYNSRYRYTQEGVDTYWLAEPLRVGLNQKHSLYVAGGEGNFLFGLGGGYNGISGVMNQSDRRIINGNIDLTYRVSKFQFSNKLSVSNSNFSNPIVPFREYANTNPYFRKTNSEGIVEQWLENIQHPLVASQIGNPIWNATRNSRNLGKNLQLTNFFQSEWLPNKEWRVRLRVGLTYDNNDTESFLSPEDSRQILNKQADRRGEYTSTNARGDKYEGDLTVSYAKLFNKHRLNLIGGGNVTSAETVLQGYGAEGFPAGDFTYPNFSSGYTLNGIPRFSNTISRSLNGYFNTGYGYDDRYLFDLSLRTNGSSIFGNARKFNTTWSVGLGWNIHREKFIIDNAPWISFFKLRGSVGNPGNQNFASGRTLLTYLFPLGVQSYFGLGALPDQIGNPNLQWQITQDRNVGLDLTLLDRRFTLNADYFHKVTDPLLISFDMPLSSGVSEYFSNAGEQVSKGWLLSASYQIIRNTQRRILWSLRFNGRTQKARIDGIGNKLDLFNNEGQGSTTTRYFDGADPDDIWAVRSLGIDPATGKELFLSKDGTPTYDFSYNNEVVVGNRRPDLEGVIGSSLTLGGFTFNVNFRYQFGAKIFNTAVRDKVENVNLNMNLDRRALYERWQNAGDIRYFKNIADVNPSPITSRFVQNERSLILESVYGEYQFTNGWIKKMGLGNLRVFASVRDALWLSSIRVERGIDYPFARVIDAGLSFNF